MDVCDSGRLNITSPPLKRVNGADDELKFILPQPTILVGVFLTLVVAMPGPVAGQVCRSPKLGPAEIELVA